MPKPVYGDLQTYGTSDLAGTHRSTARTQNAADPALVDRAMAAIEKDGFVGFERVLPEGVVEENRADIMPRSAHGGGRNGFEGFATQRVL